MRISDWSSDVCSSDLTTALCPSHLPDDANVPMPYLDITAFDWGASQPGHEAQRRNVVDRDIRPSVVSTHPSFNASGGALFTRSKRGHWAVNSRASWVQLSQDHLGHLPLAACCYERLANVGLGNVKDSTAA